MAELAQHWDGVYAGHALDQVSWHEDVPSVSLRLLSSAMPDARSVVDVGAGASRLSDRLVELGTPRVTVLDISQVALDVVRLRSTAGPAVQYVVADVTSWQADDEYDAWHDRAVFHFLVDAQDQASYIATTMAAVRVGGVVVLGVFAEDGPTECSGLPTVRWEPAELAAAFGEAFVLEHSEREEHKTPSGTIQPFSWVVLRRRTPNP